MELFGQDAAAQITAWDWSRFLQPEVMALMIPILAILIFGSIFGLKVMIDTFHRHRERMEMIRAGIHPDHPEAAADMAHALTEDRIKETTGYDG